MEIPAAAKAVLLRLTEAGYAAYAVGGCVRDSLLGTDPADWDICTSALPEQVEAVFAGERVIETGLKHGTVTVLLDRKPFEITTFRRDGDYLDHRRPAHVDFVSGLREDLLRRDFTINAMAAGLDGVIQDPFGGQEDLKARRIRCVGNPEERFGEDALRILRAMRFSSRLGFPVEDGTAAAMERCASLLAHVSPERIYRELSGILVGKDAPAVLERFSAVIRQVLPETAPSMGFQQRNPYHDKDVWGHTLEAIGYSQPDLLVRWALLLHDLGKPDCFSVDESGVGHFYGHPRRSEELARQILTRLRADHATLEDICSLVRHHEGGAPVDRVHVRRWIGRLGQEHLRLLLEVKRADCLAHVDAPGSRARYESVLAFRDLTEQVLREESCFQVKDLAINGRDVLAAGVSAGPQVGQVLEALLNDVVEEHCANTRPDLLRQISRYKETSHAD